MEKRDLYDENKNPTHQVIEKGASIPDGKRILVVIAVIENGRGQLLLQKRSEQKGGKWAFTGGHPTAGQSSLQGILCEINEELGFVPKSSQLQLFKTIKTEKTFVDLYHLKSEIDANSLVLQESEVADAKWFSKKQVDRLVAEGHFFEPHHAAYSEFQSYCTKHIK